MPFVARFHHMLEKKFDTLNRIEISRSALIHNFDFFAGFTKQQIIPVLKGNGYGHGLELVAKILSQRQFPYLAVDSYYEARQIRKLSRQPVLILGMIKPGNFARLRYDNFAFVVQDEATIHALGATKRRLKVHLECNTGMNRYGVGPAEVGAFVKLIQNYSNLELEGIMSHLADADGVDESTVDQAVQQFDHCVETARAAGATPTLLHIAQTAGSVRAKSQYANAVRLGLGLYGVNPFVRTHPCYDRLQHGLCPALRLTSTVTKVIDLDKGDRVGYNYTFTAPKKMAIGVLPIGYYEGINEQFGNHGIVKIGDTDCPIVGRACMNIMMISLDGIKARIGDEVVIYSNTPSDRNTIEALASEYDLFRYGLLARLSKDIRRIVVE